MRTLSKSRLLAYRQCRKRLWLEIHRPDLRADSAMTLAGFAAGHRVNEVARRLYDPEGTGELIDTPTKGYTAALLRSRTLLSADNPLFEAGFEAEGALAFADVMLPVKKEQDQQARRIVEVKSSTAVKDYHRDDVAIQAFLARAAGIRLSTISLAHIDSTWIYPGGEDYRGLLQEEDLGEEALTRGAEVRQWIKAAHGIAAQGVEPTVVTGSHCDSPYPCGFLDYCQAREPRSEHPISWLPRRGKRLSEYISTHGLTAMSEVPDELLNEKQRRVKTVTLSGVAHFDQKNAAQALSRHILPACFLDFETIAFAVPIWKDTRPYQQIPFQFSSHRLLASGELEHQSFLDLSGDDPTIGFAEALISACHAEGPIYVYNASFEKSRIKELAQRCPQFANELLGLNDRIVDLLPIAEHYYYHPSQQGSWSIKAVLPALCPDLNYERLDGVQNGAMAMDAYLEAIAPETTPIRKAEIRRQLGAYCALDTYALVRMWLAFTGNEDNSPCRSSSALR